MRSDRTVSQRTVAALESAERAGALVVLVTGRPPRWLRPLADAVGNRGLAICSNGAIRYALGERRIIGADLIQPDTLAEAVGRLRHALPDGAIAAEDVEGLRCEASYELDWWGRDDPTVCVTDIDGVIEQPCAKLLYRHPTMSADEMLAVVGPAIEDLLTPTHSNGNRLIEMSAYGVSKATSLAQVCARSEIAPEQVLAFGDMPNDLPMLAWAGVSYAVANAHPRVLAVVSHHTCSNDADGVAVVLERLFGEAE